MFRLTKLFLKIVVILILLLQISQTKDAYADWSTDFQSPTCSAFVFSPTSPQKIGTIINVSVTTLDNASISIATLSTSLSGVSTDLQTLKSSSSTQTSLAFSYPWDSTGKTAGTYTFSVTAYDSAGNRGVCSASFAIFPAAAPTPTPFIRVNVVGPDLSPIPTPPPYFSTACSNNLAPGSSTDCVHKTWSTITTPTLISLVGRATSSYFGGGVYLGGTTYEIGEIIADPSDGVDRKYCLTNNTDPNSYCHVWPNWSTGEKSITYALNIHPSTPTCNMPTCIPSPYIIDPSSLVTITWANPVYRGRTFPVTYVDISDKITFCDDINNNGICDCDDTNHNGICDTGEIVDAPNFYNKEVGSLETSTPAPVGFKKWTIPWSPFNPSLMIKPNTIYYVRTFNGLNSTTATCPATPPCLVPTPTPTPTKAPLVTPWLKTSGGDVHSNL